jgi:hypothetical protein
MGPHPVILWLLTLLALCAPVRSGASDALEWRVLYLPELQQVEAVLKDLASQTQVNWPREWPLLHVLTDFQTANALAGGGCYTESDHAGRTYRVAQPPSIFVTVGLLHVVRTFAAENFRLRRRTS